VGTDTDVKTFAATDGTPLPHIATGTATFSPSIANGVVYVSTFSFSAGGKVSAYALNATDTQPPELHLPGDMTVMAGDSSGAVVSYDASAEDAIDPNPTLSCTPPSGSTFAIGTTTVTCVATDASGNQANGSFSVTVLAPWDMTLTLATKDSVNPKTGVVTVTGTVNCNRDGNLSIYGTLRQEVATRATLSGNFYISVNCTAPSTLWTAQITADTGKFLPGKASLSVSAFGCELTCDFAEASRTVTLRAQ
jgi:hypothetical protein